MAAVFEVRGESNQYGYLRKKQIKMNTYTHTHTIIKVEMYGYWEGVDE